MYFKIILLYSDYDINFVFYTVIIVVITSFAFLSNYRLSEMDSAVWDDYGLLAENPNTIIDHEADIRMYTPLILCGLILLLTGLLIIVVIFCAPIVKAFKRDEQNRRLMDELQNDVFEMYPVELDEEYNVVPL